MAATINRVVLLSAAASATGTWYPLSFSDADDNSNRNVYLSIASGSMVIEATPDPMYINGVLQTPTNIAAIVSIATTGGSWHHITGPYCAIRARATGAGVAIGLL